MTRERVAVLVRQEALRYEIDLSEGQLEQFSSYLNLIEQWQSSVVRLVGNDDPEVVVREHVADSFWMYRCIGGWKGKTLIDIGSGAGFPGICLKIVERELDVTLLEVRGRKVAFLSKVAADLGLESVRAVRGRAERLARDRGFRERFDVATMRAVASLPRAIGIGLAFVRVGGCLVLVRGRTTRQDIEVAERIGGTFGGGNVVVYGETEQGWPVRGSCMVVEKARGTEGGVSEGLML